MINPIHFQQLAEMNPADVCRRALCRYDQADRTYSVPVWGHDVAITPDRHKIESTIDYPHKKENAFHFFAVHYLLGAQEKGIDGTWISEKEVPGGATFFQGPHRIPTDMVTHRFKNDLGEFSQRCQQLDGTSIEMAEAAYTFWIAQRIPVVVLYWRGDDDFGPEFSLLYDKSISSHIATDVIYALAVGICRRLGEV